MTSFSFARIFRNSLLLAMGNAISLVLMFLLVLFIARFLGPEILGKYSFAVAISAVLAGMAELGFDNLIVREVARNKSPSEKYAKHAFAARAIVSLFLLAMLVVAALLLGYAPDIIVLFTIPAYALMKATSMSFKAVFRAHEKMELEAMPVAAAAAVIFLLGAFSIIAGLGINGVGLSFAIGGLLELLLSLFLFRKSFANNARLDIGFLQKAISESVPFWLMGVIASAYFATDIVMISFMLGDAATGIYSAAYKPIVAMALLISPFIISVYPKLSEHSGGAAFIGIIKKSAKILIAISLPIAIVCAIFAQEIIAFLYGASFTESAGILSVLSVLPMLIFANLLLSASLNACGKQMSNLANIALVTTINIALNFFLISGFGVVGAAYAILASQFLYLFASLLQLIAYSRKV